MIDFLEATLDPGSDRPLRFSKRYHAGAGARIDKSVMTVQDWLTIEVRVELVRELKECF